MARSSTPRRVPFWRRRRSSRCGPIGCTSRATTSSWNSDMQQHYVIIGASLAGASAAATLRQEGFDGAVALVGAELQPPYERPPLSKEYLRGEVPFEKSLVRP